MSLSDLSRQKVKLQALARRFTHHSFEQAATPRSPIFDSGYYRPLSAIPDLSGKPVQYGDLILGTAFLAHCRVPLSKPSNDLLAHWHEPSVVQAFQHYVLSDGYCFDFNWRQDAVGGLIAIDEILGSPLYRSWWQSVTSHHRVPTRTEFLGYFLPKISHQVEANGEKLIRRTAWHNAMIVISPTTPPVSLHDTQATIVQQ
jgi:hypothetical protein